MARLIMKMALIVIVTILMPFEAMADEYVTMKEGEVKTLYVPQSVYRNATHVSGFHSEDISKVKIIDHGISWVDVQALKTTTTPVKVYFDYIKNGRTCSYVFAVTVLPGVVQAESVSAPSQITLTVGEYRKVDVTIMPRNAVYTLTWLAETDAIEVNDGMVYGKRAGRSNLLIMTDNGKSATVLVIVEPKKPVSVTLPSSIDLYPGDLVDLEAVVLPEDAGYSLTWTTSNKKVATVVSTTGRVRAQMQGVATITVTTDNNLSASCQVNVIEKPYQLNISPSATDGDMFYSTVSKMGYGNFIVPEGIEASTIIVEGGKVTRTSTYVAGDVLPGTGAYLLEAGVSGTYEFVSTNAENTHLPGENWLYPSRAGMLTAAPDETMEYWFYQLSLDAAHRANSIGFYWGPEATEGEAFVFNKAHKAYLAVPKGEGVAESNSSLFIGGTDGILASPYSDRLEYNATYNLMGVRVDGSNLNPGIYIVNGKKRLVR